MPAIIYKNADGKRVPSVTTILSNLGWNKDPLMYWAWKQGADGKNFREVSTEAADVGTIAHLGIKADICKEKFNVGHLGIKYGLKDEQIAQIKLSLAAWNEWKKQTKLKVIASEESLVSEKHQFGGTFDAAVVHGKLGILDFKTSGGVYEDYLCQIRAYGALYEENKGEKIERYHLLRLSKEDGSFHHHQWPADSPGIEKAWGVFMAACELHTARKVLKKAV